MAKKVYARARSIPDRVWGLTEGRLYPLIEECREGFSITDDHGHIQTCVWRKSEFLGREDWERVEIDESAISETEPGEGPDGCPGMPRVI
jgi:hypothetical protein